MSPKFGHKRQPDVLMRSYLATLERVTADLQSFLERLRDKEAEIIALRGEFSKCADQAEHHAKELEKDITTIKQVRVVPNQQLCKIKAEHWRIIAKWLREQSLPTKAE